MIHYKKIFAFLLLFALLSSCYKDDVINTESIDLINAERIYLNTIKGQVLDTLGEAIPSVLIEMGDKSIMTDENGKFSIVDVMISSSGIFISAAHPEYYNGGTRVYATAPITQTVLINLVPKGISQNFNNDQGATLNVGDLSQVTIPSNAFLKDNRTYEGMVTLEVYLVNPSEAKSYNKRIQVFEACACTAPIFNGAEVILKSDLNSIMYIEAYDQNGEKLTVAPEKKINIQMPTYGTNDQNSPSLFSFDEKIGFWTIGNEVTVEGDFYNVELDHFSWWGVGLAKIASDLCITFTNDNAMNDHLYTVSNTNGKVIQGGGVTYGVETCFPVPINEFLEVRIFNSCFLEIFATAVNTATDGVKSATINVENTNEDGYFIDIEVVDCDFTTLKDTVTVYYATSFSQDSLGRGVGKFEIMLDECFHPQELSFIVIQDAGNEKYTHTAQINITEAQRQYNIKVVACQDVMPEDGHLTINGITYSKVIARKNPQETLIIANEGDLEVIIGFDGFDVGSFPGRVVSFQSNVYCEGVIDIGLYGEVADVIQGTFNIPADEGLGCEAIVGEFKAIREK